MTYRPSLHAAHKVASSCACTDCNSHAAEDPAITGAHDASVGHKY